MFAALNSGVRKGLTEQVTRGRSVGLGRRLGERPSKGPEAGTCFMCRTNKGASVTGWSVGAGGLDLGVTSRPWLYFAFHPKSCPGLTGSLGTGRVSRAQRARKGS